MEVEVEVDVEVGGKGAGVEEREVLLEELQVWASYFWRLFRAGQGHQDWE